MKYNIPSILALSALLYGCAGLSSGPEARLNTASQIADQGRLSRSNFSTPTFALAGWQRLTDASSVVHIYIEGDGLAWLSRREPSLNPTPKNPLALRLAARDPAPNVVYLARPCQYNDARVAGNGACADDSYWRGKRFAPEVIAAFDAALSQIAQNFPAGFHVTGYSGGANVAGLLAARRKDVLSLRTVAGNVDNEYFTDYHHVSAMPYSLNMADEAADLAKIPQIHFIGEKDKQVPAAIAENYVSKLPSRACATLYPVPQAGHEDGWAEAWTALLRVPVRCQE